MRENEREKEEGRSENPKLERFFERAATKQAEKKTIQICSVAPAKPSSLGFYLRFVLKQRTETLDMRGAPILAPNCQAKSNEAEITAQHPLWL